MVKRKDNIECKNFIEKDEELALNNNYINKRKDDPIEVNNEEMWGNRFYYIISMISSSVGLGNAWRFPLKVFNKGGGAFILAFGLCFLILGIFPPLFEVFVGVKYKLGLRNTFNKLGKRFKGLPINFLLSLVIISIYYSNIVSWTFSYFIFSTYLPWEDCKDNKNNLTYWGFPSKECTKYYNQSFDEKFNEESINSPIEFFFDHSFLSHGYWLSKNTDNVSFNNTNDVIKYMDNKTLNEGGYLNIYLVFPFLLITWFFTYLSVFREFKFIQITSMFSIFIPIVCIIYMLVITLISPGGSNGVKKMFEIDSKDLLNIEIWKSAIIQILFSLDIGTGKLIIYASKLKSKSNYLMNTFIISVSSVIFSIFYSMIIFAIIGNMDYNIKIIDNTNLSFFDSKILREKLEGPGLMFKVLTEFFTHHNNLLNRIAFSSFFISIFLLGYGSLVGIVETLISYSMELLKEKNLFVKSERKLSSSIIVLSLFLISILFTIRRGSKLIDFFDDYLVDWILFSNVILQFGLFILTGTMKEIILLSLEEYKSYKINFIMKILTSIMWYILTPGLIILIFGFSIYNVFKDNLGKNPLYYIILKFLSLFTTLIIFFGFFIYEKYKKKYSKYKEPIIEFKNYNI